MADRKIVKLSESPVHLRPDGTVGVFSGQGYPVDAWQAGEVLWRSWLSVVIRSSIADRRATINTRIASTFPVRDFGRPVADPDNAARAADTASSGSDLPARRRSWRLGRSTSTTPSPARVR